MCDHIEFSPSVPAEQQRHCKEIVRRLSRVNLSEQRQLLERYAYVSKAGAVRSRLRMPNLTENERLALRLYGKFGLVINKSLRKPGVKYGLRDLLVAEQAVSSFRTRSGLTTISETVNPFPSRRSGSLASIVRELSDGQGLLIVAIQLIINNIIDNNFSAFADTDTLYRIARAERGVYSPRITVSSPEGASGHSRLIRPGDVIADRAFWSTTPDPFAALIRYSAEGQSATKRQPIGEDQEEILYVIEKSESLRAINISGFKLPKTLRPLSSGGPPRHGDEWTSGEFLLKSRAHFMVLGVQDTPSGVGRRIVFLKPIELTEPAILPKNPFDGSSYPHRL